MKKVLLTGLLTIGLLGGVYAQNRAINFKHDGKFSETLTEAAKSNKLIFLDAYTSWCVPCKVLAKDVFTVDSIADFFNTNFINVGYDMEKGEGLELKKRFESDIKAYPTLLFINGKGEIIHKIVGAPSAKEFLELARPALNPELSLKGLAKKFETGDRSLSTVTAYFKTLGNANDRTKAKEVATTYFDALPTTELNKPAVWDLMAKYLFNIDSKTFKYILSHRKDLNKVHTEMKVNAYILSNLSGEVGGLSGAYYMKKPVDADKEAWLTKTLSTIKGDQASELLVKLDLISSRNKGDWDGFNKAMIKMISEAAAVKGAGAKTNFMLNFTRKFTQNAPEAHLADGLKWADLLLSSDINVVNAIDLLNFKKAVYAKMGKTNELNRVDMELKLKLSDKEEQEKKGVSFSGAIKGFM